MIVATGGTAVVRAAYRSGNPSLGVGPGNVPALVDATADVARAAACLAESKAFDNSILCTNESTLIAEERVADALAAELGRQGAHVLDAEATDRVRAACYPDGRIDTALAGKDAATLAQAAGVRVPSGTRVLVAPFALIVPEEPLAHEKLFPLLGMVRVADAQRGIDGRPEPAAHRRRRPLRRDPLSRPETILAYGAALPRPAGDGQRPGSTGSSGLDTHLPPAMTVGTGFFGRSSLTENLQPRHLVQWTRVAYAADPAEPFGDFSGLEPWSAVPAAAPVAVPESRGAGADGGEAGGGEAGPSREELRRLILDELRELVRG